eukprot:TRINITY_DN748_c0_g1_i1.p1 TRINITY_DN748_c0_g1~~TRINITY_DN748_c0_g1_i1.p1  ORF type:complete len:1691 (-),score=404.32 TRINITY_DN748_c0_g1_i1:1700-6772(-)
MKREYISAMEEAAKSESVDSYSSLDDVDHISSDHKLYVWLHLLTREMALLRIHSLLFFVEVLTFGIIGMDAITPVSFSSSGVRELVAFTLLVSGSLSILLMACLFFAGIQFQFKGNIGTLVRKGVQIPLVALHAVSLLGMMYTLLLIQDCSTATSNSTGASCLTQYIMSSLMFLGLFLTLPLGFLLYPSQVMPYGIGTMRTGRFLVFKFILKLLLTTEIVIRVFIGLPLWIVWTVRFITFVVGTRFVTHRMPHMVPFGNLLFVASLSFVILSRSWVDIVGTSSNTMDLIGLSCTLLLGVFIAHFLCWKRLHGLDRSIQYPHLSPKIDRYRIFPFDEQGRRIYRAKAVGNRSVHLEDGSQIHKITSSREGHQSHPDHIGIDSAEDGMIRDEVLDEFDTSQMDREMDTAWFFDGIRSDIDVDVKLVGYASLSMEFVKRIYSESSNAFGWTPVLMLGYAKYILDFVEADVTSREDSRSLIPLLRKFHSTALDYRIEGFHLKQRRLELDESDQSSQIIIRAKLKKVNQMRYDALFVTSRFWKAVSGRKADAGHLQQMIYKMHILERRCMQAFEALMKEYSHEPSVLISYVRFCETVSGDLVKAMSLREKLAEAEDEAESKHSQKRARMAAETSKRSKSHEDYVGFEANRSPRGKDGSISGNGMAGGMLGARHGSIVHSKASLSSSDSDVANAVDKIHRFKIANTASPSIRRVRISVWVSLLVSCIALIALFIIAEDTVKSHFADDDMPVEQAKEHLSFRLQKMYMLRGALSRVSPALRMNEVAVLAGDSTESTRQNALLDEVIERFVSNLEDVLYAGDFSKGVEESWDEETEIYLVREVNNENGFELKTSDKSAYAILTEFGSVAMETQTCQNVVNGDADKYTSDCKRSTRYVLTNTNYGFGHSLEHMEHAYKDDVITSANNEVLWVSVSASAVVLLLVVMILVVLIPALRASKKEKQLLIDLVLLIPKHQAAHIYHELKASLEVTSEETGIRGSREGGVSQKNFRILLISFLRITTGILILAVIGQSFTLITFIHLFDARIVADEMKYFVETQAGLWNSYHHGVELCTGDSTYWTRDSRRALIMASILDLRVAWTRFLFGTSGKDYAEGIDGRYEKLSLAVFHGYCDDKSDYHCMSMTDIVAKMRHNFEMLATESDENLMLNHTLFEELKNHLAPEAWERIGEIGNIYSDYYKPRAENFRNWIIGIFIVSFPIMLLVYLFLLHGASKTVEEDQRQIRKIIYLLPREVLDNVPAINNFVIGAETLDKKKGNDSHRQMEQKMSMIIQASSDAFIELSDKMVIQEANEAADDLFECAHEDLIGVSMLEFLDEVSQQIMRQRVTEFVESCRVTARKGKKRSANIKLEGESLKGMSRKKATSREAVNMRCRRLRHGIGKYHRPASHEAHLTEASISLPSPSVLGHFGPQRSPLHVREGDLPVRHAVGKRESEDDDEFFAAKVSFAFSQIGKTIVLGVFVRDVTQQAKQQVLLEEERQKSNDLLLNILPHSIAERLKGGESLIADRHEFCTVLFTDIVEFTSMSTRMSPQELVGTLGKMITAFDGIADEFRAMKIKTIGDAYMAVLGLEDDVKNDPARMVEMGLAMVKKANEVGLSIRCGIHCGELIAGVVGVRKMAYDIWGSTVNLASRMESNGVPDRVQISRAVYERCYDRFTFEERTVKVKGFDEPQLAYLCKGPK